MGGGRLCSIVIKMLSSIVTPEINLLLFGSRRLFFELTAKLAILFIFRIAGEYVVMRLERVFFFIYILLQFFQEYFRLFMRIFLSGLHLLVSI